MTEGWQKRCEIGIMCMRYFVINENVRSGESTNAIDLKCTDWKKQPTNSCRSK